MPMIRIVNMYFIIGYITQITEQSSVLVLALMDRFRKITHSGTEIIGFKLMVHDLVLLKMILLGDLNLFGGQLVRQS